MAEGTFSTLTIDASAETLYDVAADVAHYPDWASGVKEVEVLDVDSEGRVDRARFVVEGFVKEIEYVLKYHHERPSLLSWVAEENADLKMLEGSYQFGPAEDEGATEVVYTLSVDPRFVLPGFIRRQAEKQIVTTALRGLRKRVASGD